MAWAMNLHCCCKPSWASARFGRHASFSLETYLAGVDNPALQFDYEVLNGNLDVYVINQAGVTHAGRFDRYSKCAWYSP